MTQDLHDAIMRLPCDPASRYPASQWSAFSDGHRDARHAAAELAIAAPEHRPDAQDDLTDAEKSIIRRALTMHGTFSYSRANQIDQDKTGATKVEWSGLAQDEGDAAYALLGHPLIARAVLAAQKAKMDLRVG